MAVPPSRRTTPYHICGSSIQPSTHPPSLQSGWPSLHPGDHHHTSLVIPAGSSVADVAVRFTFYKNQLLPLAPNHLGVQSITAKDTYSGET